MPLCVLACGKVACRLITKYASRSGGITHEVPPNVAQAASLRRFRSKDTES